jgi:glycosyltransferase involved in cell wall biosynthesis
VNMSTWAFDESPQRGLVSVVIPCYNAERFLAEALESALGQTYRDIEVIVVDDGSTDNSAEIIRSYGDRLKAQFGPNRGAGAARNVGTALARGEFIQYLDADDLLMPDAIERRIAALREGGADVAYSDWERLVEVEPGVFEVGERRVRRIEDVHPNPAIAVITHFWAPPAALTYRRSIVDKIGGWKEWLPAMEDARFLQDAVIIGGRCTYSAGVGARYRVHRGVRLSGRSDYMLHVFRNACDLHAEFQTRGQMNTEERRAFAGIYDYAARTLFFLDKTAFRECVERLYQVEPEFRLTWPKTAQLASAMIGFKAAGVLLPGFKRLRAAFPRSRKRVDITCRSI